MVNYMASHTSRINDFNQGSIVRSLIEAVSQEMFRQNVSFAQGITDSVRTSIKQAFGLPLLDAVRAYGQFTFYRKMLDAPSNVAVTYADVANNRLVRVTIATKTSSGTSGLSAGTYYYSITPVFSTGEQLGSNPVSGKMILVSPQTITLTWVAVTNATAPTSTNASATAGVGYWTPVSAGTITYTTVTLSTAFDAVLIYNSTQSNKAISVHTFGSQTITAGTFTLTLPSNTTTTALIRLSTT
jgi:hypothetical protein